MAVWKETNKKKSECSKGLLSPLPSDKKSFLVLLTHLLAHEYASSIFNLKFSY